MLYQQFNEDVYDRTRLIKSEICNIRQKTGKKGQDQTSKFLQNNNSSKYKAFIRVSVQQFCIMTTPSFDFLVVLFFVSMWTMDMICLPNLMKIKELWNVYLCRMHT